MSDDVATRLLTEVFGSTTVMAAPTPSPLPAPEPATQTEGRSEQIIGYLLVGAGAGLMGSFFGVWMAFVWMAVHR